MTTTMLVLQGANLGRLGRREPEKYGRTTAAELDAILRSHARDKGVELEIVYCNAEGDAIDRLCDAEQRKIDAVIMNPGGFSYAGYALRDCIAGLELPVFEVHITNHYARGIQSVTGAAARGVIMGMGIEGYLVALDAALRLGRSNAIG